MHNPNILSFIEVKSKTTEQKIEWKFNLSVDITQEFMNAVFNNSKYKLLDGTMLDANYVFTEIAQRAHHCGDPGIIFMERFNRENPTPLFGNYVSVAPCAEVGLISGETCQFGYINLGKFVKRNGTENKIDYNELKHAVMILTRALDNSLEISIPNYTYPKSKYVMSGRRSKNTYNVKIVNLLHLFLFVHTFQRFLLGSYFPHFLP